MDTYVVTLTILGFVVLLTAWLPMVLRDLPLSLPIICIFLGAILAWSPLALLPAFNPLENRELTEHMTEVVVIVALMGAGLKLDRKIGWRRWGTTWRLLGIAMPLTIAAIALLAGALVAPTSAAVIATASGPDVIGAALLSVTGGGHADGSGL